MLNDGSYTMRLQFKCKVLCGKNSKSNIDLSLAAKKGGGAVGNKCYCHKLKTPNRARHSINRRVLVPLL